MNKVILLLICLSGNAYCQISRNLVTHGDFSCIIPGKPDNINQTPECGWLYFNGTTDWFGPTFSPSHPNFNRGDYFFCIKVPDSTPSSEYYAGLFSNEAFYQNIDINNYTFVRHKIRYADARPCLSSNSTPNHPKPHFLELRIVQNFPKRNNDCIDGDKDGDPCFVMSPDPWDHAGFYNAFGYPKDYNKCLNFTDKVKDNTISTASISVNGTNNQWYSYSTDFEWYNKGNRGYWYVVYGGDFCFFDVVQNRVQATSPYTLVDDINLETISLCEQTCGRATEPIGSISPPNVFTPNGDGYNDFWSVPVNAFAYDLEIFSRFGNSVYKLTDEVVKKHPLTGEPCVFWNGRRKNGNLVASGLYNYVLTVKNCSGSSIPIQGNILVLDPRQLHPFAPDYDFPYAEWVCCSEEYYIENQFFTSGINYSAALTVTAVNTTAPNELTVEFTAGDEVVLGPGFVAEYGSDFRAWIEGCSPLLGKTSFDANSSTFLPDTSIQNDPALQGIDLSKIGDPDAFPTIPEIKVYPNPFGETLTIDLNGVGGDNLYVELYDINMRAVCQPFHLGSLDTDVATITLSTSNIPSGIYLVVLRKGNERLAIKKAVKYSN